jgi:hypothetical protein
MKAKPNDNERKLELWAWLKSSKLSPSDPTYRKNLLEFIRLGGKMGITPKVIDPRFYQDKNDTEERFEKRMRRRQR